MTPSLLVPPVQSLPPVAPAVPRRGETIATRVWQEEYASLQTIYASVDNVSPTFRLPDLISACVSLVFQEPSPAALIFHFLHTRLVLRDPDSPRRQEEMWMPQYLMLLDLQRSRANYHPHPQFKLDHFTTACIALVLATSDATHRILEQARRNTAQRAAALLEPGPDS
jgi:hypothetical protein